MDSVELQVFIALGVVLVAVLIALAVDFLKGSNERLRERNAALSEREKAALEKASAMERLYHQMIDLVETLKDAEQQQPVALSPPMAPPKGALVPEISPQHTMTSPVVPPDAKLVVETPIPMPEVPVSVRVVRDESELTQKDEVVEELPPAAEDLLPYLEGSAPVVRKTRRLVGQLSALAWPSPAEPLAPGATWIIDPPDWAAMLAVAALQQPETSADVPVTPAVESAEAPITEPPATSQGYLQESPELEVPQMAKVVEMPLPEPSMTAEEKTLLIPTGVRPPEILNELLKSEADFQGVTLSISVVDYVRLVAEHGRDAVEQVMAALGDLVQASGSAADLVCRISEDEFIVVCPGATGAAATLRVQQLSESLWDFQLRSLVSFPIMFSWGASESGLMPGMPRVLADSVDRAREQMLESRRSRRALTWASAKYGLQSNAG